MASKSTLAAGSPGGCGAAAAAAVELASSSNVRERFLGTRTSALFQPQKKDVPSGSKQSQAGLHVCAVNQ